MAGGGGTGAAISRPPSPDRGVPGLIGRLLQRTASSTNASTRFDWRSTESTVALKELLLSEKDENQSGPTRSRIPAVAADHQHTRSTAPDAGDIAQPQPQHTGAKPTAAAAPNLKMPSATPQPQLKKKASFKDRLKAWQKPPQPLEIVAEELKPRFVYEPTHAAADFSRLAVSPLSPSRQRLPPAMQIGPGEEAPAVPRNGQRRPRHGDEPCERPPHDEEPTRRHSRSGANRHSYTLAEDPFQASNAAAHVPVNTQPVAWTPGTQAVPSRREERTPPPSQPPSDFELFIARAEAEDRERREQVLRSMSQRSAAYPANRVRPDPHRQFAAAASSSAGRTAERSDGSGQRTSGTRYVLGSGGGVEQQPQRHERRQEGRTGGHARQSSWAASYATTSGSATGNGLEKKASPPAPAQRREVADPQQQKTIAYGVDDEFGPGREYQPQPPRTLRRQASLTQRIVQYIRPPKTAGRHVGTLVE